MHEYEVLIETINPCGGEAHAAREFGAPSPPAVCCGAGALSRSGFRQNASGDTVITTGDGKGVMIRYTFTE